MLKATIRLSDLHIPIRRAGDDFVFGQSVISPFNHRLLLAEHFTHGPETAIIVRERIRGETGTDEANAPRSPEALEHALGRARASPLDYVILRWTSDREVIQFEAASLGSAPIYVRRLGDVVRASWDPGELLEPVLPSIDSTYLSRFLLGIGAFGSETLFTDIKRLTPLSTMSVDRDSLTVTYPPPRDGVVISALAEDADPEHLFIEAVSAITELRPLDRNTIAVEVSGGMDSAITSLVAAKVMGANLLGYGAVFDGTAGCAQRLRRNMISKVAGLDDIAVAAHRFPPYGANSARRTPLAIWPHDENYPEIFEPLIAFCQSAGIDTLITGSGGDELYPLYRHEMAEKTVAPPNPLFTERAHRLACYDGDGFPYIGLLGSVWSAAAARSQRLLSFGVWPVYPFHNDLLANFTFRLPLHLRQDRTLHRRVLTRLTGFDTFERDYEKETFSDTLQLGFEQASDFISTLLSQSKAVAGGFIEGDALDRLLAKPPGQLTRSEQDSLFFLVNFETFVRDQPVTFSE